jgi:AraC family transcriptional regulator, regulatory protein of adaptative response / methylated-DNA-[protein]-cysteine methyltransferase
MCLSASRFPRSEIAYGDSRFHALVAKVTAFVENPAAGLDAPLDLCGTAFQQRVWKALREIPPGKTASYAEIAGRIGVPKSFRAVAQACAANNIAVAVPCHRVIGRDGALSGYRCGVERKRWLLERERRAEDALLPPGPLRAKQRHESRSTEPSRARGAFLRGP